MRHSLLLLCLLTACVDDAGVADAGPSADDAGVADAGALAANGAPCDSDEGCVSGLCGGLSVCGANECAVVGEACDALTVCTGGPCERTCAAPAQRGESCLFRSDDNPCPTTATCAAPLVCGVSGFGVTKFANGACVPASERGEGEPCGDDVASCAAPLTCAPPGERCR